MISDGDRALLLRVARDGARAFTGDEIVRGVAAELVTRGLIRAVSEGAGAFDFVLTEEGIAALEQP